MNKRIFINQMDRLQNLFQKELTPSQTTAYWHELAPMSDDEFIKACHWIVKNEIYFPKIACFLMDSIYRREKKEKEPFDSSELKEY